MAIDKPSFKFRSFLAKHFNLKDFKDQANNYVVFRQFWDPVPQGWVYKPSDRPTPPHTLPASDTAPGHQLNPAVTPAACAADGLGRSAGVHEPRGIRGFTGVGNAVAIESKSSETGFSDARRSYIPSWTSSGSVLFHNLSYAIYVPKLHSWFLLITLPSTPSLLHGFVSLSDNILLINPFLLHHRSRRLTFVSVPNLIIAVGQGRTITIPFHHVHLSGHRGTASVEIMCRQH